MFIRRIETLLFTLLMICALAIPAQAQNTQNCLGRGSDCTFNDDSNNATGGSIGDVSGGAGGKVDIKYPDQPVNSPAIAFGGVCQSAVSVTTRGGAASIGSGDQLCRHIELIKLGLMLYKTLDTKEGQQAKMADVERLYQETLAMERRGSWFRRCKWTGWITGFPIIGRLF